MGLLDDLKATAKKVRADASEHRTQIDRGIDKVADVVDNQTGHRHAKHIAKATDLAHNLVQKLEDDAPDQPS